jgi:hypothetical protein
MRDKEERMRKRVGQAIAVGISLSLGGCGIMGPGCDTVLSWSVTPTEATLAVGESITATAEANDCGGPGVNIRWSSENPAVASVNAMTGLISGVTAGSTTIVGEDLSHYGIGPVQIPVSVEP